MLRRFRRPLPLAFIFLSFLILLGGMLYPPSNHTALTYRIPRVLQWLSHGHWFWIHTSNYRMNNRACGIEWLSAPLLLFTNSDRSLFLLNYIPFLLLPGLVFSLFTRIGVCSRVSWQWMWLLPTGYTFLLQAASAGNDTFPTVYALASLDFACRAWVSRRPSDWGHSLLAAALLTGAKASNLPLLLPWLIVWLPLSFLGRGMGNGRDSLTLPVSRKPNDKSDGRKAPQFFTITFIRVWMVVLALLASFLPTAILNIHYCGDWSGLALESTGMDMKNPFVGIWGNFFLFLLDNFVPPLFPAASWWNQNALSVLPHFISAPLVSNFENGFHWLGELPTEDWAGIGFGLSWLILFAIIAVWRAPSSQNMSCVRCDALPPRIRRWVLLAPWVALVAYSAKSGMATGARLISPYYPLLLPLLLAGARPSQILSRRWWRISVGIVVALAVPVIILTPGRPLWPAQTVLTHWKKQHSGNRLISRALNVYSVYGIRNDPLAAVRALLPGDLPVVGFLARGDDPDISFWRPFGERRVEHFLVTDSPAEIRRRGIEYLVAAEFNFSLNGTTFAAWQQRTGARLIATTNATVRVSEGPQPWYILRFPK